MLQVPSLDDMSYEEMIQRAIRRIPILTDQWTDFNQHDPGITVLETYAWLLDMLNYYMDATGELHIRKYLKLLGLNPIESQPASTYLKMEAGEEGLQLPAGTPVYAGDISFETQDSYQIHSNHMVSCINEVDGTGVELIWFAGVDGDYAPIFAKEFSEQAVVYLGFANPLKDQVTFQVCVQDNPRRNPFSRQFSMSKLTWQYHSSRGWVTIPEIQDDTCGFLRSGSLICSLPQGTAPYRHPQGEAPAHYIRCILEEYTYDMAPRLGQVYVNPCPVLQQKTLSRVLQLEYQGQERLELPVYLPEQAYVMVGIAGGAGKGTLIYDSGSEMEFGIELELGTRPGMGSLVFSKKARPENGVILEVFVICQELFSDFRLGWTDGCANQEVDFTWDGVHQIQVSTWKEKPLGRHEYQHWSYVPMLEQAGYQDYVFTYDEDTGKLMFGDGEHGVVPDPGQKICVTALCCSQFARGNVMEQEIKEISWTELHCYNPKGAVGGRDREQLSQLRFRMQQELFAQQRMVSQEDYKKIVSITPGLLIDDVAVIPGNRYRQLHDVPCRDNEVVLVVKPCGSEVCTRLSGFYRQEIEAHLEEKRLINTKVRLASPTYVGIEVSGRIQLNHRSEQARQEVLELLQQLLVTQSGTTEFGKKLVLGRIFSRLEICSAVNRVHSLVLERQGQGASKNQNGDIQLQEDALGYIAGINLEFC